MKNSSKIQKVSSVLSKAIWSVSLLLIMVVGVSNANAQITYIWNGSTSTNWNVASNWSPSSGSSTPGTASTDIVLIPTTASNQPTLSTALANSIASLTFTSTTVATLTITGQTLNVSGAVTLNSNNSNSTACTITGTGTISCGLIVVGTSVTPNGANRTSIITSSISNFTSSSTLTLLVNDASGTGTRTNTPTFTQSGGTVSVSGFVTSVGINTGGDPLSCNYTMSGTNPTLNITGSSPFGGLSATPTNSFTFNSTGATVDYSYSGAQTVYTTPPYTNLKLSGSGIKTLGGNLTVSSTFTYGSSTTLALSSYSLTLNGNFVNNSSNQITGNGTFTIAGTINQSIAAFNTAGSVSMTKTGGTATLSGNVSATTLTVNGTGGTLTLSGTNTFTGTKTLTNGTLNINSTGALGGGGAITISGGTINNTSGSSITLADNNDITIGGSFTFTGSNALNLGTGTITLSADPTITSAGSTLTLAGVISAAAKNLTKAGNGNLSFGANAVTLNSLSISAGTLISTPNSLTLSGNFTKTGTFTHNSGTVIFNSASAQTISGSGITFSTLNMSGAGQKTVSNSITVVVGITLDAGTTAILADGTTSTSDLLTLYEGTVAGTWGGNSSTATYKNGTFFPTSNTGTITVAHAAGALPVKLISFNGTRSAASSQLNFVTATEINNDKFEIERSINGIDFIKVGEVKGSGNSTQLVNYTFTDHNLANYATVAIYYRMKQLDYNGDFEYSNTIKLSLNTSTVKTNAVVSPNPFTNELQVVLPNTTAEHTTLSIMTLYGAHAMDLSPALENRGIISINTEALAAGVYMLYVNQDGVITNTKIIKK